MRHRTISTSAAPTHKSPASGRRHLGVEGLKRVSRSYSVLLRTLYRGKDTYVVCDGLFFCEGHLLLVVAKVHNQTGLADVLGVLE